MSNSDRSRRPVFLVGYDGQAPARDALALGELLALETGGYVAPACVFDDRSPAAQLQAVRAMSEAISDVVADGLALEGTALPGRSPVDALAEAAALEHAEALVVGSSERGPLGRVFPGGTGERLLRHAAVRVAIAPRGLAGRRAPRLQLVGTAYDGWPESRAALAYATAFAERAGARLLVLMAVDPRSAASAVAPLPYDAEAALMSHREAAERWLDDALAELPARVQAGGEILSGRPAEAVAGAATEFGLDLLVVGSRGRGPVGRVLLGSVSHGLVRELPCSLMVVPAESRG